jgi:DNA-binding MarR family transcriptional regulator/GNAT superfamily N-acetyltransferase
MTEAASSSAVKPSAVNSSPVNPSETAAFRGFNRMYTRWIGSLNEGLLNTSYSLAEARVLYELATRESSKAREIAEALGLDPGYLSRLLGKFEQSGLLKRKPSGQDGRSIELSLTPSGKSAFRKLNALSEEQAESILQSLTLPARTELIGCMKTIEGILKPSDSAKISLLLRPHRVGDMGWIVYSEGIGYAQQYGWDSSFEALVAKIVSEFVTGFDPICERCWIAEIDGRSVGHIFLVKHRAEPGTAKLRLLFVDPSARGLGLGDVLVTECVRFAKTAGYRKITLWTQSILTAAHRIYQRAGFRLVKEEPHTSFGQQLLGQEWELELG